MMVRYARERGYKGDGKDPHLTLGRTYTVFGITFQPDSVKYPPHVCCMTDTDRDPAIWPLHLFDFVSESVSDDWAFTNLGNGYYRLCPKEFLGDFWERFHDANEEAERTFQQVREKLEKFHSVKRKQL